MKIVNKLIIAISNDFSKDYFFSVEERVLIIKNSLYKDLKFSKKKIQVISIETLTTTFSIDPTQTETKKWTSTYSHKFGSSSVNTGSNTIAWTGNQLRQGDALLYIPPSGDSQIGGLERFQIYYVKVANTDSISLCETTNGNFTGNAEINLSSQGTSNFGRHQLMLCYELGYCQKLYRWIFSYTRYRHIVKVLDGIYRTMLLVIIAIMV